MDLRVVLGDVAHDFGRLVLVVDRHDQQLRGFDPGRLQKVGPAGIAEEHFQTEGAQHLEEVSLRFGG